MNDDKTTSNKDEDVKGTCKGVIGATSRAADNLLRRVGTESKAFVTAALEHVIGAGADCVLLSVIYPPQLGGI